MPRIVIKKFQQKAIDELGESFIGLWQTGNYRLPITFKAPTGSGKTIMMAEFLKTLDSHFILDVDKAYIWISFGGDDSYIQSKNKLYDYFNQGTDMQLKDINNLSEKELYKNNVFFINWSKIKATNKEGRKLRQATERQEGGIGIFDAYIKNTQDEDRDLILIIDESHREAKGQLYDDIIELINPRIIMKVSATPEDKDMFSHADVKDKKAGYVEVPEVDVRESGLIKNKTIIQTDEDIKQKQSKGLSEDDIMLELACEKRLKLKAMYQKKNKDINPLMLIQVPNDDRQSQALGTQKIETIKAYLYQKGIKPEQIAIWLSEQKENLDYIVQNHSKVDFLIFKQAAATGWDCPRAAVLVMFREIQSPVFRTQVLGRIKRMPEAQHYNQTELNNAYVFTNYRKNDLHNIDQTDPNKPPYYNTELKQNIAQIELQSSYHKRTDFNTITPPDLWQKTFLDTLDKEFKTKVVLLKENVTENHKAIENEIFINDKIVKNNIIVNAEVESYDDFMKELKQKASSMEFSLSKRDVEKLYNSLCYDILKKQTDDDAKYNASRSYGQLKEGLNVWFKERFGVDNYYPAIVNELISPKQSKLRGVITIALIEFRKNYEKKLREKQKEDNYPIMIPAEEISFTEDYEEQNKFKKNCYNKFYLLKKDYHGKKTEIDFMKFIDNEKNIEWWHKQGDHGRDNFAIEYFDTNKKTTRLFYPDFIIKTKNDLFILDTKGGNNITSQETKDKLKGLREYLKNNKNTKAGIVKFSSGSSNWEYTNDLSNWTLLEF
ncbi:MAG: DEAD/DEAH box helicase [Alphaproteobacteria bacterium]